MRQAVVAVLSVLVLGTARSAWSQVNVEPFRKQLKERGFGVRIGASATSYAGNTRGVALGGSAFAGFRSAAHVAYVATSGSYTALGGTVNIANWFTHLRYDYELSERVSWEAFTQLESDRFRRITWRQLLGTGPRVTLLDEEWLEAFLGTAYMYEYTTLSGDALGEDGGAHRTSSHLMISLRAHPKIALGSVTYFQPRIDALQDFRILSVADADFEVTKRLHSRLTAKFRYDARPPAGVEAADLELASAFEVLF